MTTADKFESQLLTTTELLLKTGGSFQCDKLQIPLSQLTVKGMTHGRLTKREDCHAAYRSHKTSPIADASASIASATSEGTCGLLRRQATSSRTVRSASFRLRDSDWTIVANSFDLISSESRLLSIEFRSFISGSFLCSRRRNFCSDQLGPDQPPVIGTEVATGYCAGGGKFDGWAMFNREFSFFIPPKTHGLCSYAKDSRHRRWATYKVDCFLNWCHAKNSTLVELGFQQVSLFCFSTSV